MKGEYVVIAGWPVQFRPPTGPLIDEALVEVAEMDVEGLDAKVFRTEYLVAIALQTGRSKDKSRLLQFLEEDAIDTDRFQDIVRRYQLVDAWTKFERQFLGDAT